MKLRAIGVRVPTDLYCDAERWLAHYNAFHANRLDFFRLNMSDFFRLAMRSYLDLQNPEKIFLSTSGRSLEGYEIDNS